jgi:hypothetical protein
LPSTQTITLYTVTGSTTWIKFYKKLI